MKKMYVLIFGLFFAIPAFAVGSIIVAAVAGSAWVAANAALATAIAFAINMVVSTVISKALFTPNQPSYDSNTLAGNSPNPGNRQQIPPATDNKLPVVYGSAWVGGQIVDLSITSDNQDIYYVLALSEVTNSNDGQTPDAITFGDVYYGGKKVIFKTNGASYSAVGAVSSVASATVYVGNISQMPVAGDKFTFSNVLTPTIYTVASVAIDDIETGGSITFTTTVTGVSSGATIYAYSFDSDYATKVTGLLDESTGVVDTKVANKIQIYLYNNGSNSPANSSTSAISVMQADGLIYKWDINKQMTHCAFAILHLTYNNEAGIRGIEQTRFQVINSRTNTGDCFADYLINTRYGAAIKADQIDYDSLAELNAYGAENFTYTDADGNVTTQPRFKFDGILETNRTIMSNLQAMSSCCDCLLKYNEITAKWGVIVQKPTYTVAMAIDDSNIVSAIQITPIDLSNSFNVIECKFPDKENQDAFNTATFDLAQLDPTLLFPNEPVNKQSVSLPLVNNDVRAQYIATRLLKGAREDLQVDCSVGFIGIQLEAGDIVTITNANYGWVAKPFRINKVIESFGDDGAIVCKLLLMEFNASVYDDTAITQFQPSPNSGIGDPLFFGSVPAPTITTQYPTNTNPLFIVNVTTSSSGIIQYAEVWYSAFSHPTASQMIFAGTSEVQANGTPWLPSYALPPISLANIPAGNWYFFSRMVNSLGSSIFSPASDIFRWRPSTFQFTEKYLTVAYADDINGGGFSLSPTNKYYFGLCNQTTVSPSLNAADYTWYLADPAFGTNIYLAYCNRTGRKFSFDTGFAGYAAGTGAFVPTQALVFDPSIWSALPNGTNYIDLDVRTGQLLQTGTTTVGTGEIGITNNPDGKIVANLKQYLDFGTGVYQKTSAVANLTIDIYGRVVGFEAPDEFYYTEQVFTATSGQTVFSVTRSAGYISGQCLVLQNGLLLNPTEYTDTSGATGTVTFATGRTAGDVITIASMKSVNGSTGVYASFTRHDVSLTNASSYTPSGFTITSGYELLFLNGTVVNEQDYDIVGGDVTNFPSIVTGNLTVIEWSANNLGIPNGNPVNVVTNTVIGQTVYSFSYTASSFNLYNNGVLLRQSVDYSTGTGNYTLTNTPTSIANVLLQQTFARTGAV